MVSTLCYPFYSFLFVLTPTFCPSPLRLTAVAAAAVRRLNTMSDTTGQYAIADSATLCPICWAGRFFVVHFSAGDGDGSIKASVFVPPSGTLSKFSRSLCLILSYCISTTTILVVPHICFGPYPLSPSSSRIYFVVPTGSPFCHISAAAVSIFPFLRQSSHPDLCHCTPRVPPFLPSF